MIAAPDNSAERRRPREQTSARHAALHATLLSEAERLVEGEGLGGFRARTLAGRAGCALGAIYTIFPDLDSLILEVNGLTLDAIDRAMRDGADGLQADPRAALARLAETYLDYVSRNPKRADALFSHRFSEPRAVPEWYRRQQASVFRHVETPLASLRPDLSPEARGSLARTLFSAVHGVVSLGLDQKLEPIEPHALREQLLAAVDAFARGLAG